MKRARLVLITLFAAASCAPKALDRDIVPPLTAPLSRSVIGYGVVTTNYTHVLDRQGEGGISLGFLRKGAIVQVLERTAVVLAGKTENWSFVSGAYQGWLKEDELRMYETEAKAKTAASTLSAW
ncbi:MAG: hypothetical protein LBC72_04925 [Spirochaetaceae bacterium]|nr:hypothetical protein [Spirochaetaceae bacterium]